MKKPRIRIYWFPTIYTLELIDNGEGLQWTTGRRPVLAYGFFQPPYGMQYLSFGEYFCHNWKYIRNLA